MPNGNDSSLTLKLPALPALTAMTTGNTLPEVLAAMGPGGVAAQLPGPPPPVNTNAVIPTNTRRAPANIDPTTSPLPGMASFGTGYAASPAASALPSAVLSAPSPSVIPQLQTDTGALTPGWNPQRVAPPAASNLPAAELPPGTGMDIGSTLTGPLASSSLPVGGTVSPAGAAPINLPQPANIPPRTFGQKLGNILGKIGGYALSAVDPGLAAMIPGTPIGKIAAQERGLTQAELVNRMALQQAQAKQALAGATKDQAEAIKAIAEGQGTWEQWGNMLYNKVTRQIVPGPPGLRALTTPEALIPLTPQQLTQSNSVSGMSWNQLFPGQPIDPSFQLRPGALPADRTFVEQALNRLLEMKKNLSAEQFNEQQKDIMNQMHQAELDLRRQTTEQTLQAPLRASYDFQANKLDEIDKPLGKMSSNLSAAIQSARDKTQEADTVLIPQFLKVTAGGEGSGVRLNSTEMNRVAGGAKAWDQLMAKASKWTPGADKGYFDDTQRNEMLQVLLQAQGKTRAQQAVTNNAWRILNSPTSSIEDHRNAVYNARTGLEAINNNAPPEGWSWTSQNNVPGVVSADGKQFRPYSGQ